jgi:protein-S-isoprenylcysteine O-methyltransferase Ste14
MRDLPGIVLAATIWVYWFGVAVMIVRVRRETDSLAGLVPEQRQERLLWLVWVPLVAAWLVLPYLALVRGRPPWIAPAPLRGESAYVVLRSVAALAAVAALLLTSTCWSRMGRQWRMDVSTVRPGELITDGPFRYVRHPIYALQRLLMLASLAIVPTWPMLVLVLAHLGLTQLKARYEERHLTSVHGTAYRAYAAETGAFLPRPRPRRARRPAEREHPRPGEEP